MPLIVMTLSRWRRRLTPSTAVLLLLLLLSWFSCAVQATAFLSFRVVDEQGEPLADAVVAVFAVDQQEAENRDPGAGRYLIRLPVQADANDPGQDASTCGGDNLLTFELLGWWPS